MTNILIISKRELFRLRSRFRGRSRPATALLLAVALALAFLASRQLSVMGDGLYRVGISPDGPQVSDSRFTTLVVDRATGEALLQKQIIDVYIDGAKVISRSDPKSQYATGALRRYLERQELTRISDQFDLDRAFPLRIAVTYLDSTPGDTSTPGPSLQELLNAPAPTNTASSSGAAPSSGETAAPSGQTSSASDAAVREQLSQAETGNGLPPMKIESTSAQQIVIPSLMNPPVPFMQVILAFLYILPISFVSVFFTSSFMDEKTNRKLTLLLSAPITPFQIILGKMLPYVCFSLVSIGVIGLITQGNPVLPLVIFAPVILFIFSVYLMVPLLYRTYKDTTFISLLATTLILSYLIFPAMFSGISDLAYMSPLTLAVKMYSGEAFGLKEYLFSTTPMILLFALSLYAGTRMLNEEYLMGFRPLFRKIADAIYLILNRQHPNLSVAALSLLLVPIVYMLQLVILVLSLNLPLSYAIGSTLVVAVVIEEISKSVGIVVLMEHGIGRSVRQVLVLAFLSALGFLIGEKALLFISLSVVSQSALSSVLFSSGLLIVPLAAHWLFTTLACLLVRSGKVRYPYAILAATIVHSAYNFFLAGGLR
jgi:ABC-type Na+ efflux pump permease subunit